MGIEPLGLAERDRRRTERRAAARARISGSSALHEVEHAESPDEKRAERAVGSTWLEPPT